MLRHHTGIHQNRSPASGQIKGLVPKKNEKYRKQTMTIVEISSGICGFKTTVTAEDKGAYKACFHLDSQCPNWKKVNDILGGQELNLMTELFKDKATGELNSQVIDVSLKTIPHVSCPVISGILKALEVCAGLALPKDAAIEFKDGA